MAKLRPKNWLRFQHYRDRSPPWIKLHRDLLNDRAFMSLALASKAIAPLLWLLACESADGSFDGDPVELAFRLRMSEKEVKSGLEPLLRAGFFETVLADASNLHTSATSEREGETEREAECAASAAEPHPGKVVILKPADIPDQVWTDWLAHRKAKKAPVSATALDGIKREAAKAGMPIGDALQHAIAQGWQGFRADWVKPSQATGRMASSAPAAMRHIRNVEIGFPTCHCKECVDYRAKRVQ